jgi:hypothetical protein
MWATWWTDDKVEELKRRWRANESASQIARLMEASSRNAVIGKAHRLGLSKRTLGLITTKSTVRTKRVRRLVNAGNRLVLTEQVDAVIDETPFDNFKNPKSFAQLNDGDCRWPGLEQMFCAAPVVAGRRYCAHHCRMAYILTPRLKAVRA